MTSTARLMAVPLTKIDQPFAWAKKASKFCYYAGSISRKNAIMFDNFNLCVCILLAASFRVLPSVSIFPDSLCWLFPRAKNSTLEPFCVSPQLFPKLFCSFALWIPKYILSKMRKILPILFLGWETRMHEILNKLSKTTQKLREYHKIVVKSDLFLSLRLYPCPISLQNSQNSQNLWHNVWEKTSICSVFQHNSYQKTFENCLVWGFRRREVNWAIAVNLGKFTKKSHNTRIVLSSKAQIESTSHGQFTKTLSAKSKQKSQNFLS